MSKRIRIIRGVAANLGSLATRIAVQFVTLPIFFANWSAGQVGIWLLLFAVPAYIGLVGSGFSGAGGNAALAEYQAGNIKRARVHFHASWMISAAFTAILAVFFAIGFSRLATGISALNTVEASTLEATLGWLALYIFATCQIAIFEIPFRAAGRYPDHIGLYSCASLIEIAIIAVCVIQSDSLAILAMALTRCLAAIVIFSMAYRAAPQMFSVGHGPIGASVMELWKPSFAFMLMPLIYGINMQGYVLLLGTIVAPAIVAGFVATRMLTRLLDLMSSFTYAMQFYESGYIEGPKEHIQAQILATMTLVAFGFSAVLALCLMAIGDWLQDVFTLGQTSFDPAIAMILLLAAILRALSASPFAMLTAANRHGWVALSYFTGSVGALALAGLFGVMDFGLPIILLPILLAEVCQFIPAMRGALQMLGMSFPTFLRMLFTRERVSDIIWAMQTLRRTH